MGRDPRRMLAGLSLAVLTAVSCLDDHYAGPVWDGSATDSAGVEIVLNHGMPLWADSSGWILSEALRIGAPEGEPEYMFGRLVGMAVLSDGRIVIADGMAQHLRFFQPDGRWEMTVGRAGSGPGEFGRGSLQILVGPGDTLLVVDSQNQRANRISPAGTWLDSWRSAPEEGWMVRAWDYSPSGRIVIHLTRVPGTAENASEANDLVVLRSLKGAQGDTVGVVAASQLRQFSGGRMEFYLYAGEPVVSLCPDNSLVTGRGDRWEFKRFDANGDLRQIIRLERPNAPISTDDKEFLRGRFREIYLENGFPPARVDELLSAMHFTETYPAFTTLRCGPDGSVWVQPVKPVAALTEEERREFWVGPDAETAAYFDVFDGRGRYLGVVHLPEGSWPSVFHGNSLFGRWRDSLDVEYVQALRIEGMIPK